MSCSFDTKLKIKCARPLSQNYSMTGLRIQKGGTVVVNLRPRVITLFFSAVNRPVEYDDP